MLTNQLGGFASPLSDEQIKQLNALSATLNPIQQAWVSGYFAGLSQAQPVSQGVQATQVAAPAAPLTILFGSQTGNAKGVAKQIDAAAKARGIETRLMNMADYKAKHLKADKFIVASVATYGEGEPPEDAETLHELLTSKKAPKLDGVKVAVVGLGDSSYEFFCQTGIDFEERFLKLGAESVVPRADLDVDYEDVVGEWIESALNAFEKDIKAQSQGQAPAMPQGVMPMAAESAFNKQNPFTADVTVVQKITGRDSTKDVRHVEISLEESGLTYQPGDSLGVYFANQASQVDALIDSLGLAADTEVTLGKDTLTLRDALMDKLELTQSYPGFVEKYAAAIGSEALSTLAEDKIAMRDYLAERQIYDIIREYPGTLSAQQLVDSLRKIQPRLYSIASSQAEVEEEVHLTVGVVEYTAFEQQHFGGCSGFLANDALDKGEVKVFVEHNDNFRLPSDDTTPIVMIGPGTGIAPFRAFLQERDARDAKGDNWLFFGNPHFTQDFLYQVEIQGYLKSGLLNRVDVAFSRDQAEKVYVQDKIRKQGASLVAWLERGAHLYICGDANRMAKDVHNALVDIVREHKGINEADAESYLKAMREQGRYQKDVY